MEPEAFVGPDGPRVVLEDIEADLVQAEGAEGVPQHGPHRLRPVAPRPIGGLSDDDPHLRLPMRPVDLVQADVADVDLIDVDREDLLVAPPLVVAEPSLLLRQRHGRIPAGAVDDRQVRGPYEAPWEGRLRDRPE